MTGFASTEIAVRTSDGINMTLLEPVVFTRPSGEVITVRAGATSDGVSSPRATWCAVPPFGRWWLAGVLHDACYRLQTKPLITERAVADAIFLEALVDLGVPAPLCEVLFEAVHRCGEAAWIRDRVPDAGVLP